MKRKIIIISSIISIMCICIGVVCTFYYKVKPAIELNGKKEITLKLNETYKEEKAFANLYYQDISKYIKISGSVDTTNIGKYIITYTVDVPYLHHEATVERVINVVDEEAPVIELTGSDVSLYVGESYQEIGFKASDNYDGDITDKVEINNPVNTLKKGEYTITYTVTDSSNNTVSKERKVIVKEKITTTKKTENPNKNGDNTSVTNKKGTGNGVAILMYHYFYDKSAGEEGKDSNWMEIHAFEEQIKYLSENNYYFPTWQEIADFVDGKKSLPKKSVVITIDDGHKSLFNLAIPIIEKYNVKATSFIISSYAGGKKFSKYKSEKMNFESHTHNMHQGGCSGGHGGLFRCISYDKGIEDLKKSMSVLGSHEAIAYPYGDVTNNVLKITKDAGFKVGVTTNYGKAKKGMDRYQLPRIRMSKGMSLASFKASL